MKINVITLVIAFAIAALAGYGFYAANNAETDLPLVIAIGGGIALFIPLAGAIAVSTEDDRGATLNIRMVSGIFFGITLITQIIFCFVPFSPAYIIVTGTMFLIYLLIAYSIGKRLQGRK